MKEYLKITLVQPDLVWENASENKSKIASHLAKVETDLIVLPEMFTTGFSMKPEIWAEPENGESLKWMQDLAVEKNAAVCGSIIIHENDNYYNRLYFVYPDRSFKKYNKRHLFTLAGEEKHYAAGDVILDLEYLGWKIRPLICYDLRFPVWARNTDQYDLLLFVANWPAKRSFAWNTLLKARSIENLCYTAGVNRVGDDGNGMAHSGNSVLIDPLGETVISFKNGEEGIVTSEISFKKLEETRNRFRFLADQDEFKIL